jgi:peptide/nickel transport system permease protein
VLLYIVRRMALAVSVVFATMVLAFFLFFAGPGDPALNLCGDAKCNTQRVEEIRKSFHLDEPVSKQFADYALGVVAGREITSGGFTKPCPAPCLGYSFKTDQPVTGLLVARIPVTLSILCGAFVIYLLIGIPTGVYAANRRGTAVDRAIVGTTQTIGSIPYFVPALLFSLYLTILHPLFPRGDYHPLSEGLVKWASGLLAAWIVLGIFGSTGYTRYVRASMVESLAQDYVRTAKSKGISHHKVLFKHALRAALSPVLTIFGLDLAASFGGVIFTESIFDLHGVGYTAVNALRTSDLPVIMGCLIFSAAMVVGMNLVVDLVYGFVDPRVKVS